MSPLIPDNVINHETKQTSMDIFKNKHEVFRNAQLGSSISSFFFDKMFKGMVKINVMYLPVQLRIEFLKQ